jgi:hypothetical protein
MQFSDKPIAKYHQHVAEWLAPVRASGRNRALMALANKNGN